MISAGLRDSNNLAENNFIGICNDFSNATNMRALVWIDLGTFVPLRAGPRRHLAWELRGQGLVLYSILYGRGFGPLLGPTRRRQCAKTERMATSPVQTAII